MESLSRLNLNKNTNKPNDNMVFKRTPLYQSNELIN